MKKTLLPILLIALVSFGDTCSKNSPDCHEYYTIKNDSNGAIYFRWSRDSALNSLSYSPGSSPVEYKCAAKGNAKDNRRGCYEAEINLSSLKKINIWIFDANIIETVQWDTVKKNYLILKKYSLTKEQLDSANWIINYP
jgi:hypothetical protein